MTDQDLLFQAAHALITAYDCIDGEDEKQVAEKAIEALLDRLATVDLAKVGEIGVWGEAMTDRELMQWALDALEGYARNCRCEGGGAPCDAAEALRARLAQPKQPDWSAAGFGKPQPDLAKVGKVGVWGHGENNAV